MNRYEAEDYRRKKVIFVALSKRNYSLNRLDGKIIISIPAKKGAPYGNTNAIGNKGGGAPFDNCNAEKHGLYSNVIKKTLLRDFYNEVSKRGCHNLLTREAIKIANEVICLKLKRQSCPLIDADEVIACVKNRLK